MAWRRQQQHQRIHQWRGMAITAASNNRVIAALPQRGNQRIAPQ